MSSSIHISSDDFATLSEAAQNEILALFGRAASADAAAAGEDDSDQPLELTASMCRRLLGTMSEKTRKTLRLIADQPAPEFRISQIAALHGERVDDFIALRGVWAAITRRARLIGGDPDGNLIIWDAAQRDAGGNYIDQVGRVAPLTHGSLRRAFGV